MFERLAVYKLLITAQGSARFHRSPKTAAVKSIAARSLAAVLLVIASQSSFARQRSHPRVAYKIHVDASDLSGFTVEMRVRRAGDTVRLAMASHPEYDDRYWRYVENLSAEARGVALSVMREEDALWRVRAPGGDLYVKYRIPLPSQTAPTRAARP